MRPTKAHQSLCKGCISRHHKTLVKLTPSKPWGCISLLFPLSKNPTLPVMNVGCQTGASNTGSLCLHIAGNLLPSLRCCAVSAPSTISIKQKAPCDPTLNSFIISASHFFSSSSQCTWKFFPFFGENITAISHPSSNPRWIMISTINPFVTAKFISVTCHPYCNTTARTHSVSLSVPVAASCLPISL